MTGSPEVKAAAPAMWVAAAQIPRTKAPQQKATAINSHGR